MASYNVAPLEELVDQLPVCPASAKDGSAAVLLCARPSRGEAEKVADAIVEAHKKSLLQNMPKSHRQGKSARCALRSTRDRETICVVEDPRRHGIRADGGITTDFIMCSTGSFPPWTAWVPTEYA